MRRLALVAPALVLPFLPLAPASAAGSVICVAKVDASCTANAASISAALTAANGNGVDDTILVGPGTYSDGPYMLPGSTVTLVGSGAGSTILTLPSAAGSQLYLGADSATVQDLTIQMAGGALSAGDRGLSLSDGATARRVEVVGPTVENATGIQAANSQLLSSSVQLAPANGARALYGEGGNTVLDSTFGADQAYAVSGNPLNPDEVSRSTFEAGASGGVNMDAGALHLDDAVIDLGTSTGSAIQLANFNNSAIVKSVTADHVTIVGGGNGSTGVWAYAATAGAKQSSTVQLTNSIVRGPATDLVTDAGNNGAQGGSSVATIQVSHSDYHSTGGTIGANGSGGVVSGAGNLDVAPAFADAAAGDYRLTPGSPVVDRGDAAAGGPALDRDGTARVVDGDGDGSAVRDLGAYELHDSTAPQTTVLSGPGGLTKDRTPTFTFASEDGATFACRVDAAAFAPCSGPGDSHTTPVLGEGPHTFAVRATDPSANTDATPAVRSFRIDSLAPQTRITSKPSARTTQGRVRFKLAASEAATFRCRLNRQRWRSCSSPTRVRVKPGRHRFSVRATDRAGNTDPTPATFTFRRVTG